MQFMMIGKLAGRGITSPRERTERCNDKIATLDIRLVQRMLTAGSYDFCTLLDAPSLAAATTFNLWWIGQGFGQAEMLQVFDDTEFAAIADMMGSAA